MPCANCLKAVIPALRAGPHTGRPWRRLSGGAVFTFARRVDLVGALARPAAAGAGAVPLTCAARRPAPPTGR